MDYEEILEYSKAVTLAEDDDDLSVITEGTYDKFALLVKGKEGTPYEGGQFRFNIKLEHQSFPFIRAETLIWHPNIDPMISPNHTNVCNHILNVNNWDGNKQDITDVIAMIKGLVHMKEPYYIGLSHPLNDELTEDGFEKKAKQWTSTFAKY